MGQNTEIIAKGQLGTDLIDTGYSCLIHCIILVPPGWPGPGRISRPKSALCVTRLRPEVSTLW